MIYSLFVIAIYRNYTEPLFKHYSLYLCKQHSGKLTSSVKCWKKEIQNNETLDVTSSRFDMLSVFLAAKGINIKKKMYLYAFWYPKVNISVRLCQVLSFHRYIYRYIRATLKKLSHPNIYPRAKLYTNLQEMNLQRTKMGF